MKIILFSEIKWDYLKTRKQQIFSRFPKDYKILFIEPISNKIKNKFLLRDYAPIYPITIPQLRSTRKKLITKILNIKIIRDSLSLISLIWLRIILFYLQFKPEMIIISNVYWSYPILKWSKLRNIPIIYDCNDDPLSFPDTPTFKKVFFDYTLIISNYIVIPHKSYIDIIKPFYNKKIKIIPNGVDIELFNKKIINAPEIKSNNRKKIVYIGAIHSSLDFNLINKISKTIDNIIVLLVGPILDVSNNTINTLRKESTIIFYEPIKHQEIPDFLSIADVCIIPFKKDELTVKVLPNKLFEYSAAGKTTVMTNFNPYLREFEQYVRIADNDEQFIQYIIHSIDNPIPSAKLKCFAKQYDWSKISLQYLKFLKSIKQN